MRRAFFAAIAVIALLLTGVVSGTASAASWRSFSSASVGFALRYPASWTVTALNQYGTKEVRFSHQGSPTYTLDVTVLPLKSGTKLAELKKRFLAYQQRAGNVTMVSVRWASVSVAGHAGMGGVYIPATEGGVSLADGIYVLPWRAHVYVLTIVSVQRPSPARLSDFPAVYRQILATWRFR